MRAAAEHGAGLTEQMLAYAGRAPQALKPLNLSALVAEMLDLARASLSVRVVLRETLAADVWVQGDETQLRQVVLNLVANAGESFGEQAGAVELTTRSVRATASELASARGGARLAPGHYALLEVTDDGPGMDDATQRACLRALLQHQVVRARARARRRARHRARSWWRGRAVERARARQPLPGVAAGRRRGSRRAGTQRGGRGAGRAPARACW